jgi:hypothetical protein
MGTDISLRSIVVATDEHVHAEIEGETVVLHTDAQTYYSLNPVAGRIWELLQEPRSVEEIRDTISREYDAPVARCETDLFEFLESLAEQGLVECRRP